MSSSRLTRRELIVKAGRFSLTSILGFNYGCSIAPLLGGKDKKTALIYGTKYGSTKDTAHWIYSGIGEKIDVFNVEDISLSNTADFYDHIILGSGIWIDGVHDRLKDFLTNYSELLSGKIIATFIVCGTDGSTDSGRKRIDGYFKKFHSSITVKPLFSEYFGGRIIVEKLTNEDREILIEFYRTYLNSELTNWDRTDSEKANRFGFSLANLHFKNTYKVIDKIISKAV